MQGSRPVRQFPRIRSEYPIRARVLGKDEVEEYSSTRVIGLGGCSFLSSRSLGHQALVELVVPLDRGMVRVDGRVAYEIAREDGALEIGVEFLHVPREHLARIRALFSGSDGEPPC